MAYRQIFSQIIESPKGKRKKTSTRPASKEWYAPEKKLIECISKVIDIYFNDIASEKKFPKRYLINGILYGFHEKSKSVYKMNPDKSFTNFCKQFGLVPRNDIEIIIYANATFEEIKLD